MRILVTGSTGFIGTHLCHSLVNQGHEVVALVRTPAKASKLPGGVQVLTGDLTLFAQPDTDLPAVDVVVHLAGVVAAPTLDQYEAINYTAVVDLVDCLERQDWTPKRLVFASSLAAAGPSPADRPWTEADPVAPIEPYGEAKARAEQAIRKASFATTAFRPCIVLGPEDPATLTLYQAAQRGIGLQTGATPQRLSVVDVRDVVRAIEHMCADTREGHHTYFVSHPTPTDIRQLWAALGTALGRSVWVVTLPKFVLRSLVPFTTFGSRLLGKTNQLDAKQVRQMCAPAFVCSSQALTDDLGWTADHDLASSLAHAVAGYRASGQLPG